MANLEKKHYKESANPYEIGPVVAPGIESAPVNEVSVGFEKNQRPSKHADHHVKIVVVGDGGSGKTCLLISYTRGSFPTDYVPTIFENYVTKVKTPQGKIIELALWDTAGQEEYNRLRPLSYTDVDIFLICYAIDNRTSLFNVEELWMPEVRHFCPDVPAILVGLKSDLYANDNIDALVDPKEAELFATQLGAFSHMQCSAKTKENVDEIFNVAMRTALQVELKSQQTPRSKRDRLSRAFLDKAPEKKKKKRRCNIL